jgi:diguanylate cyclase (GGDEF)-like protein
MKGSVMPIEILIVDDEESLRGILSQVLEEDGFIVGEASSGEEALEIFFHKPYPIVFTDIRMGGMSGLQLLEELKRTHPETQVIIITSNASLDSAITALRAGAYEFLLKPFEDLNLISAVAKRAAEKIELMRENQALINKLKEKNQELELSNRVLSELASRDGLSGLYNHRYFQESLKKELIRSARHKHKLSLLFIDIDYFKSYNDNNGHPAGDLVIRTISKILTKSFRFSDLVARYGGEEFTVILPETDRVMAKNIAETIRRRIADFPFPGRDNQPGGVLSISVGLASYPDDGNTSEGLVRQADIALYTAKESGRNMVIDLKSDDDSENSPT